MINLEMQKILIGSIHTTDTAPIIVFETINRAQMESPIAEFLHQFDSGDLELWLKNAKKITNIGFRIVSFLEVELEFGNTKKIALEIINTSKGPQLCATAVTAKPSQDQDILLSFSLAGIKLDGSDKSDSFLHDIAESALKTLWNFYKTEKDQAA